MRNWCLGVFAAIILSELALAAQTVTKTPLDLVSVTDLPDIAGDVDHLAIDPVGQKLFLAAEDNGTLRVIDLVTGKLERTVRGFKTPHSILFLPESKELYVTDGSKAVQVLDSGTFQVKKRIPMTPGADSVAVDHDHHLLYAVSGGKDVSMTRSAISEIDTANGHLLREIPVEAAHVEAMALERSGSRLFVNVTDKNYLAVVDRKANKIVAQWPIKEARQNAPIAFDEEHHRLFIVCRQPGKLVVLDSTDGRSVANFPTGERADEAVFDPLHRRVYVTSGEGSIYVYQQLDADHYDLLAPIKSAPGAKTALLSPDSTRFFVAVSPGDGPPGAKVLMYRVN
jgi:DNA-binding beta-propeller fold protein YncE